MSSVVIVTDSPAFAAHIASMLPERIDSTNFGSAREAIEFVRSSDSAPKIVIADMQIGTMGGIALCMELKLDDSLRETPHSRVLLLLDRRADVHLAKRAQADGWLTKPLNALRFTAAVRALQAGNTYYDTANAPTPRLVGAISAENENV